MKQVVGLVAFFGLLLGITGAILPGSSSEQSNNSAPDGAQNSEVRSTLDNSQEYSATDTVVTRQLEEFEQVPFGTEEVFSDQYSKGSTNIISAGRNGKLKRIYDVKYEDGVEQSRTEISNVLVEAPVTQVIAVGTYVAPATKPLAGMDNCDPNYTPCVPNSTSDLDCADVRARVQVIGNDYHRLDGDDDGVGCESYN